MNTFLTPYLSEFFSTARNIRWSKARRRRFHQKLATNSRTATDFAKESQYGL